MKRTLLIAVILISVAALAIIAPRSCNSSSNSLQTQTIKVGILKHESTLPYYVARSRGMFKEAGLDVILQELPPSDHLPALISGRIDVMSPTSFPTLLGMASENPDACYAFLLGAERLDTVPVYGILKRKDAIGKSIRDFQTGVIMAINPYTKVNLEMIYNKVGMPPSNRPEIRVASREAALQAVLNKTAVAVIMDQPALAIALQDSNLELLEANPRAKYIGDPYWSGAGAITQRSWNDNPEKYRKMLEVLDKAIDEIRKNPVECHEILAKELGVDPSIANKIGGYHYAKSDEKIEMDGISKTITALKDADLLKKEVDLNKLFPETIYSK